MTESEFRILPTALLMLASALLMLSGCLSSLRPNSIVIARVNDFQITSDDLIEELRQFHLYQMRSSQAGELDITSFLNDMIDRRLFIQEARRMGLDQNPGFQKALSDKREDVCLQVLKEEKIVKPCGPLTQGDIDAYYREHGQVPPRLAEMSMFESQSVKMRKEEHFSQVYIQGLKQRSKIEIFEQKIELPEQKLAKAESFRADMMNLRNDPDPVATVNGESISGQDLYEEIKTKVAGMNGKDDAGRIALFAKDGLNRLIEYWLLRQEADRQGYLKRKDVKKRLQQAEDNLLYHTFLQNVLGPKVHVESEEIERYYQDNLSSFRSETMVYLEQIAAEDPNSAREIYRELLQGTDFAFLASQKAKEAKGVEPQRGRWVSLQEMQPELKSMISASGLKEGQILPPVKLGREYTIFRVREKKGEEQIPLEKVRLRIEKEVTSQKLRSTAKDWLQRLRAASKIVIDENNVQRIVSMHQL
jgi:parvulin-like peptidyl-prolyl isomerase